MQVLESLFGPNGAVVAQYLITLIVVLALVLLVVWLVRRYAMTGISTAARGRMPRLAIVDALSLDSRHRLVLVRRDNVEHLVLIGGPTNLVVEPSIMRTRVAQRPGQPQPGQPPGENSRAAAPPPPSPAPPSASAAPTLVRRQGPAMADEPIPFPPRVQRAQAAHPRPASTRPTRLPVRPVESPAPVLRRPAAIDVEIDETTIEDAAITEEAIRVPRSVDPTADDADTGDAAPEVEPPRGLIAELRAATGEPHSIFAPRHDARQVDGAEIRGGGSEVTETQPDRGPIAAIGASAPKVTDLEKEMARLLGEISSGRSS
jgi:flagellar protein FliO/FliZ